MAHKSLARVLRWGVAEGLTGLRCMPGKEGQISKVQTAQALRSNLAE